MATATPFPLAGTGQLLFSLAKSNQKPRPRSRSRGERCEAPQALRNSSEATRFAWPLLRQTVLAWVSLWLSPTHRPGKRQWAKRHGASLFDTYLPGSSPGNSLTIALGTALWQFSGHSAVTWRAVDKNYKLAQPRMSDERPAKRSKLGLRSSTGACRFLQLRPRREHQALNFCFFWFKPKEVIWFLGGDNGGVA